MILNDKIVAAYVEGFSGVYIYGPTDKLDEVASLFEENFETAWNEAMDAAEDEYDAACEEKEEEIEVPATVSKEKDRLFISVAPLYLSMNYGARADNQFGPEALENTLKQLKAQYPEIKYEGVIAYEWSDEHSGDVVNYEISSEKLDSENTKTYDFIGTALKMLLDNEDLAEDFWEKMEYEMEDAEDEDFEEVIKDFQAYGISGDALDRILEMAEEYDPDLREELESTIESSDENDDDEEDEEDE